MALAHFGVRDQQGYWIGLISADVQCLRVTVLTVVAIPQHMHIVPNILRDRVRLFTHIAKIAD